MTTIPFNFWLGRFGIAAIWLLLASSALSAETARTYLIEGRGSMSLSVPEGWAEEFDTTGDGLPPTIRLQDAKARVKVLITPILSDRNDPAFNSTANINEFMSQVAKRMEPTAVERSLPLRAIDVAAGRGCFFWATDRAPKPGEYEYLAQGAVPTGPLLVQFTILTHDPYPMGTSKGLAIIKSVRFKPWTVAQLARAAFASRIPRDRAARGETGMAKAPSLRRLPHTPTTRCSRTAGNDRRWSSQAPPSRRKTPRVRAVAGTNVQEHRRQTAVPQPKGSARDATRLTIPKATTPRAI